MNYLIIVLIVISILCAILNTTTFFVLKYKYRKYFDSLFDNEILLSLRDIVIMIIPIISIVSMYVIVNHLNIIIKDEKKQALKFKKISDFNQTPLQYEMIERLDAAITMITLMDYTINSKYGFEMNDETLSVFMKNGKKEFTLNIVFKRKKVSNILVIMTAAGTSIKMNTVHFYDAIHLIESNT